MICLDTNAAIAAIGDNPPIVRRRLTESLADRVVVGLPTVVLYELWYGVTKSARVAANTGALTAFLTLNLTLWPFDPDDAVEAGEIRATLNEKVDRSVPTTS